MRRPALALLALFLAAGCGSGGSDDLRTVAAAVREVEQRGADFQLTVTEVMTAGDIPRGRYSKAVYASAGQVMDDNAALVLGSKEASTGKMTADFDLIVNDSTIFVRPHGSTRDWYTSWTFIAEEFIPGVRLNLVRETALLASRVSKSTSFSGGAFLNQYTVTPSPDQLHQLMSFASSGTLTATLESGNHLTKLDGHFVGTDSSTKRHLVVDSTLTFTHLGHARHPLIPPGGLAVQPADLFSTTAGQ